MRRYVVRLITVLMTGSLLSSFIVSNGGRKSINKLIDLLQNEKDYEKIDLEEYYSPYDVSKIAIEEINSVSSVKDYYKIKQSMYVKDFHNNSYVFTSFDPCGYSVISYYDLDTVEVVPFHKTEILDPNVDYRYVQNSGLMIREGDIYKSVLSNYAITVENVDEISRNDNPLLKQRRDLSKVNKRIKRSGSIDPVPSNWRIDVTQQVIYADKEVDHAWFFKYNNNQFAYAEPRADKNQYWYTSNPNAPDKPGKGLCEYVSFLLIMEYHQYFSAHGYFSQIERLKYEHPYTYMTTRFEDAIPRIDNTWVLDMWKRNNYRIDLTVGYVNSMYSDFMVGKSISSNKRYAVLGFGNPKNDIENNRPVMLCGALSNPEGLAAHNIVAYGYFTQGVYKDKFLTHYGWKGNYSQCISSLPFFPTYYWSVENQNQHICGSDFYVNGVYRCGHESN